MWPVVFAMIGVMSVILIAGTAKASGDVVAGRTYRFFWVVRPPIDVFQADALSTALRAAGAESITLNQGAKETAGSHVMKNLTTKKLELGKPLLALGGSELILTDVKEI